MDAEFESVSSQLLKRTQAMLDKYRLLLFEESKVPLIISAFLGVWKCPCGCLACLCMSLCGVMGSCDTLLVFHSSSSGWGPRPSW